MALVNINPPPATIADTYEESFADLSAAAGANTATFTTVPAGEVWVIEGAMAYDTTTKITAVSVGIFRGVSLYLAARIAPTAAQDAVQLSSPLMLFPGDALRFLWSGCVLNDDIYANAVGVKFAIELL